MRTRNPFQIEIQNFKPKRTVTSTEILAVNELNTSNNKPKVRTKSVSKYFCICTASQNENRKEVYNFIQRVSISVDVPPIKAILQ